MVDSPECVDFLTKAGFNLIAYDQRRNTSAIVTRFFYKSFLR